THLTITPRSHACTSMRCRPPTSTLFPYTTLFRSRVNFAERIEAGHADRVDHFICGDHAREAGALRIAEHRGELRRNATKLCAERSEEHTSELQSPYDLVCLLLLEKKKKTPRRKDG